MRRTGGCGDQLVCVLRVLCVLQALSSVYAGSSVTPLSDVQCALSLPPSPPAPSSFLNDGLSLANVAQAQVRC